MYSVKNNGCLSKFQSGELTLSQPCTSNSVKVQIEMTTSGLYKIKNGDRCLQSAALSNTAEYAKLIFKAECNDSRLWFEFIPLNA